MAFSFAYHKELIKCTMQSDSTSDISDLQVELTVKKDLIHIFDEKNKELITENENLKEHNKKLVDNNSKLKTELDGALSRLSKVAGQKLTDENPAITDLSNPNRPAKLGEKWSTLYTDEWTDLYEEMTSKVKSENDLDGSIEKKIIKIVEWCYNQCIETRRKQKEDISKQLWNVVRTIHCLGSEPSTPVTDMNRVNGMFCMASNTLVPAMEPFQEVVTQSLNKCSDTLLSSLKKICGNDYKKKTADCSTIEIKFVEKCCELCWYMCITNPQMVIEYKNFENYPVDSNKFNQYNRNGSIVEYVVWPALLLHENGPVLSKGTAQVLLEPGKQATPKTSVQPKSTAVDEHNSKSEKYETKL